MTKSPDYPPIGFPIQLFVKIEPSQLTDAINVLILDINAEFKILIASGGGGGGGGVPTVGNKTVADLAVMSAAEGTQAFAVNGLKIGESAGAGTGVPVYYSLGAWRTFIDAPVAQ